MNAPARITMLGTAEARLREFLVSHPGGHERAAAVLLRRFTASIDDLAQSDRYMVVEVVPFDDDWITSSSPVHVNFRMSALLELFRRCEDEGLVFGFVHNHPGGPLAFSRRDDENESTLLRAISNRNGLHVTFVALLFCDERWIARTRAASALHDPVDVRHVNVIDGHRMHLHLGNTGALNREDEEDEVLARQAAAFGKPFVRQTRSLRIGIVGASGTGSPAATLLARSGAGELVFIDPDVVARTNLNRMRGARARDVGRNKAGTLRQYVLDLELGNAVAAFATNIDQDRDALDALATCDVILGCTDDEIGRDVLNAMCFYCGIPLIDTGLGGWIDKDPSGQIRLRGHFGRVSSVCPEAGDCLRCQGVVTPQGVRRQHALRENPNLSEAELRERYLDGGGEPAPGVGPFTSATADLAVATLYDLLSGYRKWPESLRRDCFFIDFVFMEMRSPESTADKQCSYCGTRKQLLKNSKFRLGQPTLGVAKVAY